MSLRTLSAQFIEIQKTLDFYLDEKGEVWAVFIKEDDQRRFPLKSLVIQAQLEELAALDAKGKKVSASVDALMYECVRYASQAFIRPFVMQWLELEQPITIAQEHINKQDFRFARYYKVSMRDETIAYIGKLIADNRPAKELIVSDWTMMNDALAIHYGYPGIEGGELRKVKLRPDDPRGGGVLGHAGIQSMLCWMGENWVIYRGAWALRHVLDHPPPPPPLEVPELNPSEGKNKGKPFRELLKQHQNDSRCAVCHKNIDPVGFAFQNFDISGRWRNVEFESYKRGELDGRISWRGVGETRPVDSVGNLPRGEAFKTFAEFKQIVVKDYQSDMVRGIMKNLMIYGTGRIPGIDEMMEIKSIGSIPETGSCSCGVTRCGYLRLRLGRSDLCACLQFGRHVRRLPLPIQPTIVCHTFRDFLECRLPPATQHQATQTPASPPRSLLSKKCCYPSSAN